MPTDRIDSRRAGWYTIPVSHKSYLIACGVLRPDVSAILRETEMDLEATYLEGGLHEDPAELRRRVQAAIDEAEGQGYEFIILGYGMCGRGTVGLVARDTPLLIPRVHDCIALFLGSDRAYREEFQRYPGTYYVSAGWYDEKVQPRGARCRWKPGSGDSEQRNDLARKYGNENADAIVDFLTSWRRNYQRAVFIDTGVPGKRRYDSYARAMAREFGWRYERIEGRHDLLLKLFDVQRRHEEILVVPPGHTTLYDARRQRLAAAPPATSGRGIVPENRKHDGGPAHAAGDQTTPPAGDPTAPTASDQTAPAVGGVVPEAAQRAGVQPATAEAGTTEDAGPAAHAAAPGPRGAGARHLGLGIDAGGTYTDAVVFDFGARAVLATGKALTTTWDYSVGITRAVDQLPSQLLSGVELAAISTTLATNAIVEGRGQRVGLILLPSQFYDPSRIAHSPQAVVSGRLDISGRELEPVDPEEVRATVRRMVAEAGVKAFAVSGYAASVNPSHELAVRDVIMEETSCAVCLGSELSELLDFYVRANTAVLNARILPLLAGFMTDVERALAEREVSAPVMVVRGDGSLMTDRFAADHPVETVMSGPAASVAGARYLTGLSDALVVDVGGTTSDIARVAEGTVQIQDSGSRVGAWRTHVRAVDMRTEGVGGDSEIRWERRALTVGPRRVTPVSLLGAGHDGAPALSYLGDHLDDFDETTAPMTILAASGRRPTFEMTAAEAEVWELVSDRPYSLHELAEACGVDHWSLVRTSRLLEESCLLSCGLTPTDLLHVSGDLELWDGESARRFASVFARVAGLSVDELVAESFRTITESLVTRIFEKQFGADAGAGTGAGASAGALGRRMIANILAGGDDAMRLTARLPYPLVGLGAAAPYILDGPVRVLQADFRVPEHAEVANAVGAITSMVSVRRSVSVVTSDSGGYLVHGLSGAPEFESFEAASAYASDELRARVVELARAAGTDEESVSMEIHDHLSETSAGAQVFLERRIIGSITGAPALGVHPGGGA